MQAADAGAAPEAAKESTNPVEAQLALVGEVRALAERARRLDALDSEVEGELSKSFFEFTPVGAVNTERPEMLVTQLERSASIDPLAPVASRKPVGRVAKRLVRKLVFWYMSYVTGQVLRFASYATRLIITHEERLAALEEALAGTHTSSMAPSIVPCEPVDLGVWAAQASAALRPVAGGLRPPGGPESGVSAFRVLHASCQDGSLVKRLRDDGIDAYGVDERRSLIEAGLARGASPDLREEEVFGHLESVGCSGLAGAVLTGFVEQLERHRLPHLLELLRAAIAPGGVVVLCSAAPEAWSRTRSSLEVDLAPAGPLHASTWVSLLAMHGFDDLQVYESSAGQALAMADDTGEVAAAINANFQVLNGLLFPPSAYCVVGKRSA